MNVFHMKLNFYPYLVPQTILTTPIKVKCV